MKFISASEEVYYADEQIVVVNSVDIANLKDYASNATRRKSRLCAHQNVESTLHEMLIVHPHGTYVRPHRHHNKSESLHIIDGKASVFFFDENGRVTRKLDMGEYQSGLPFFYRIDEPIFHALLVRSEILIFHEVTGGPFFRSDTEFPSWAPDELDVRGVELFQAKMMAL